MLNNLIHISDTARPRNVVCGNNAGPFSANCNPSIPDLLSHNRELASKNRLLSAALARLTKDAATLRSKLTPRQHEAMSMVLAGHPNKNIAPDLHISQRTVENHRAAIMRRTGTASLPALVRLSLGVTSYDRN
ncbi:response regulator transcription factor [Sulfitobacter sp.]|uniref:response regulator transcription factor n=1 Tax=Sulfitobacter sp. TaxID=1903071 RepID=UPI003001D0FB